MIKIRAVHRVVAGMKIGRGGLNALDPDVVRAVQRDKAFSSFSGCHVSGREATATWPVAWTPLSVLSRTDHRATGYS